MEFVEPGPCKLWDQMRWGIVIAIISKLPYEKENGGEDVAIFAKEPGPQRLNKVPHG